MRSQKGSALAGAISILTTDRPSSRATPSMNSASMRPYPLPRTSGLISRISLPSKEADRLIVYDENMDLGISLAPCLLG